MSTPAAPVVCRAMNPGVDLSTNTERGGVPTEKLRCGAASHGAGCAGGSGEANVVRVLTHRGGAAARRTRCLPPVAPAANA